jgi:hypothetical protein
MSTTYSKIRGRSKGYRYRNSIVDLQRDLQKANAKKTKEELEENQMFEDDPRALKEVEYGRVVRKPTTMTYAMKKGDVFND